MIEYSAEEQIQKSISTAKRNCLLCMGRARLRPGDERNTALGAVKKLVELYDGQFDNFRAKDADAVYIQKALANKRHCMDIVDLCDSCDKQVDKINRELNKIK